MLRFAINLMLPCFIMPGCYHLFNWALSYFNPFKYILSDLLSIRSLKRHQLICLLFFAGIVYLLKVMQLCPTPLITDYLFVDIPLGIILMMGIVVNQNLKQSISN